jgi:glycine oxidase
VASIGPRSKGYDVAVVGAGLIGLACAWRASQRGLSVVVIERGGADELPAGASGVAAGMLAPVTEAEFGEEGLLRLNLASRELWPGFAAELEERTGRSCGYRESGALVVAADRDDVEELRRLHGFQRSLGLDAEWLPPRECRRLEPALSPRVGGGILAPQDGHVDPRAVAGALRVALEAVGTELRCGVEAQAVEAEGGQVTGVRTSAGSFAAGAVVVAAGPWSAALAPEGAGPPVRPVKGQLLELRVRLGFPEPVNRIVRTPRCYLLSRGDGRVVLGATVEERGFDTAVTADGVYRLLEAAWEVVPEVAELELVRARAGLRPGSPDNAPLIGAGEPGGIVWATGHYRNGVLLTPITARAVADLLAGDEPSPAVAGFGPERFAALEGVR